MAFAKLFKIKIINVNSAGLHAIRLTGRNKKKKGAKFSSYLNTLELIKN